MAAAVLRGPTPTAGALSLDLLVRGAPAKSLRSSFWRESGSPGDDECVAKHEIVTVGMYLSFTL